MLVVMEYRIKGYSVADAVKPNPFHGKRKFFANTDDLGTTDMAEIEAAARDTAPDGYELHNVAAV